MSTGVEMQRRLRKSGHGNGVFKARDLAARDWCDAMRRGNINVADSRYKDERRHSKRDEHNVTGHAFRTTRHGGGEIIYGKRTMIPKVAWRDLLSMCSHGVGKSRLRR